MAVAGLIIVLIFPQKRFKGSRNRTEIRVINFRKMIKRYKNWPMSSPGSISNLEMKIDTTI